METRKGKLGFFLLLIILAVISIFAGRYLSDPGHLTSLTDSLNETKTKVEVLAASSTAASAAITLLPGDIATPIAEKLADLSFYFLWILAAVFLEKVLVTISGFVVFQIIIPAGLVLEAIEGFFAAHFHKFGRKLVALGLVLGLVVPVSVHISNMIQNQYQEEINATVEAAEQNANTIQGTADRTDDGTGTSAWSDLTNKIKGGSEALMNELKTMLNNFVEAVAVYLVTSCLIPILTFMIGMWLIKQIFGISGNMITRLPTRAEMKKLLTVSDDGNGQEQNAESSTNITTIRRETP